MVMLARPGSYWFLRTKTLWPAGRVARNVFDGNSEAVSRRGSPTTVLPLIWSGRNALTNERACSPTR
jgi:hypothetical protein